MIGPDPVLKHRDLAFSSSALADLFSKRVLPSVMPGSELTDATIADVTYSPGRRCVVLCALDVAGQADQNKTWAVVHFAKDDRFAAISDRVYGNSASPSPQAVHLSDLHCLVELFPADWQLPTLASVLSSETEILHYCPHRRCVIRFPATMEDTTGLVGKLFPCGDEALGAWRNLATVHGLDTEFSIPKPMRLVADMNLVLMADVGGVPLDGLLEADGSDAVADDVVIRAASALSTLHSQLQPLVAGTTRTICDDIETLRSRTERLHLVVGDFANRVDVLLSRLEAKAGSLAAPVSLIHGDFKPSQLLVGGDVIHLVDFDRTCLGDAALDVGNFTAQLIKSALVTEREQLRSLALGFMAQYLEKTEDSTLVERVPTVECLTLARLAVREFRHAPHEFNGSSSLAVQLLDEAERCSSYL